MTNAGEGPGAFQSALATAPPRPPQFTTRIPDCGTTPLDGLGEVDRQTLNRLLPSRRQPGPGFNSSI